MASPAQAAANLANAQHSSGPRTEAGKRRASLNALKHGLNSAQIVVAGESQEEYDAFRDELYLQWTPANATEAALVDQFATADWRLRRISRLEAQTLESGEDAGFRRLNILSLHSSRLVRASSAALHHLRQLQNDRRQREEEQMQAAMLLRKADLAARRPTDLSRIGFVLNIAEIDLRHREQALDEARNIIKMARNRQAA
jgi:hypothetical protein